MVVGPAEVSIEHLHSGDADAVHPFQVSGDAFLGDVAAHPMPPNTGFCGVRRILEFLFHRSQILRRLGEGAECESEEGDNRDGANKTKDPHAASLADLDGARTFKPAANLLSIEN